MKSHGQIAAFFLTVLAAFQPARAATVPVPNAGDTYGLSAAYPDGKELLYVVSVRAIQIYDVAAGLWTTAYRPTHGQIVTFRVDPDSGNFSWTSETHAGANTLTAERFARLREGGAVHSFTTVGGDLVCWGNGGNAHCTTDGQQVKDINLGFGADEMPVLGLLGTDLYGATGRGLRCRRQDGSACAQPMAWSEEPLRFTRWKDTLWLLTQQAVWRIDATGVKKFMEANGAELIAVKGETVAVVAQGRCMVMDLTGKVLREMPVPADIRGLALAGAEPDVYVLTAGAIEDIRPMAVSALTPKLGTPADALAKLGTARKLNDLLAEVREHYLGGARMNADLGGAIRARGWVPQLDLDGSISRSYGDRESVDKDHSFSGGAFLFSTPYSSFTFDRDKVLSAQVGLSWDLDRLLFSSDELSYQSQHRANMAFAEDALTRAINFYAEWKQKLIELTGGLPDADATARWLRVETLEGYLDILTAGWFTAASK